MKTLLSSLEIVAAIIAGAVVLCLGAYLILKWLGNARKNKDNYDRREDQIYRYSMPKKEKLKN